MTEEISTYNDDETLELIAAIKDDESLFNQYKELRVKLAALDAEVDRAEHILSGLLKFEVDNEIDENSYLNAFRLKLLHSLRDNTELKNNMINGFAVKLDGLPDATDVDKGLDYELDGVAEDEQIRCFREYYINVCKYRYEFAKLAENVIDPFLLHSYKDEYENLRMFNANNENVDDAEPISLTFKLHRFKPYQMALKQLDAFYDNVKAYMNVHYHVYKHVYGGYYLNPDVLRDENGRAVDLKNPSKLFARWERYINAYNLRKQSELTLAKIATKIGRDSNTEVDKASAARKDIIEAERLIASAVKGTFPN